jgi:phage terminase large subunit
MIPADDRRIPGWRVLKEYLSLREGKPHLYIVSGCTHLINSMQSLLCDVNKIEDAANEPHHLTHTPEALRYAVMTRFEPSFEEKADHNFKFLTKKNPIQTYLDY